MCVCVCVCVCVLNYLYFSFYDKAYYYSKNNSFEIIPVYDRLEITLRVIINKIIFRSLSKRHVNITYS